MPIKSTLPMDRLEKRIAQALLFYLNLHSRRIETFLFARCIKEVGISKANTIFSWTSKAELVALYNLASTCPPGALALEIGSYLGASSCYLATGLKQVDGHLFCVDTWYNETMPEGKKDTFVEFLRNTSSLRPIISPIRKRSHDLSALDIQVPLSLVFIDGDHSYAAVKSDFALVQQWITDDGIIAFHDFGNPNHEGVSRVVGEALASGKWTIAGMVDSLVWIKSAKWFDPPWLINQ